MKAQYVPRVIRNILKYRGPIAVKGKVMTRMLPTAQMIIGIAIWKARSLKRAEEMATPTEAKKAKKYGGPERRSVWLVPNPSEATIEGKK